MTTKDPPHLDPRQSAHSARNETHALSTVAVHTPGSAPQRRLSTEEAAAVLRMRPQSLLKRHSQTGAYFNVRPIKLPNGRLSWPADIFELLAKSHP